MVLPLPRLTRILFGFWRGVGSGLVATAILGILVTFGPVIFHQLRFRLSPPSVSQTSGFGEILGQIEAEEAEREFVRRRAAELGAPDSYFSIVVPKIDAKARILPNVNAADPNVYMEALSQGVAHAAGSVFPGMSGATYLFAHSTDAPLNVARYNAVFYLLHELEVGDEIFVFFLDRLFVYKVTETLIVEPADVSWLAEAREGEERLILQTCWPPGTTFKRLLVIMKPIQMF